MDIVDRIKELVAEKGITITELENKCDLPAKSIYKWNKNQPSIDRVVRVAKYLKVDINYLLGITEYKTKYQEWDAKYNKNGELSKEVKKIEAIDTIAAHLEDKEITDEQLKGLELYIDGVFSKRNK